MKIFGLHISRYDFQSLYIEEMSKKIAWVRSQALRANNMTPEELEQALAIPAEHPVFKAVMRIFDQHIEDQVSELEKPVNAVNPYVSSFLQGGLNSLRDLRDKIEFGRSRAYGKNKTDEKKAVRQAL